MLRGPMRLAEHDEGGALAQAIEAHPADALREGCHGQDTVAVGDLEPARESLKRHLLQPRRERGELGYPGRPRGHRDLDYLRRVGGFRGRGRRRKPGLFKLTELRLGDDRSRSGRFLNPPQLVLAEARWQRQDDRAEVRDRELQHDVLPDVRQAHAHHVARLHASLGHQ